jgi:hypothetical protein
MNEFDITEGLTLLIASFYVFHISYPTSSSAGGFLLFIQEILLELPERNIKKTSKYNSLIHILL